MLRKKEEHDEIFVICFPPSLCKTCYSKVSIIRPSDIRPPVQLASWYGWFNNPKDNRARLSSDEFTTKANYCEQGQTRSENLPNKFIKRRFRVIKLIAAIVLEGWKVTFIVFRELKEGCKGWVCWRGGVRGDGYTGECATIEYSLDCIRVEGVMESSFSFVAIDNNTIIV